MPLGVKFNQYIPEENQFTPAKLVGQLKKKGYEVNVHDDQELCILPLSTSQVSRSLLSYWHIPQTLFSTSCLHLKA